MSAKLSPHWRRALAGFLILLTGCLSPGKRVARELPGLHSRWQAEVARQAALPERTLDWPQALDLLRTNNLKLRAARIDITNSQELARQVFHDLIPNLNLQSGFGKSLSSLATPSPDDVTFNVNSFFNVPGVVNFNARLFAARLQVLRAKTACQLAEREQTIELYRLFLTARENGELAAELKCRRILADAVRNADKLAGQMMLGEISTRELELAKAREDLQTRIGDLLMDSRHRWILTSNGLPEFDYASRPLPLGDTNRVAQLQMKLAAIELVGAWAQIQGIKLQYWPELAIFVTGPSVFQRVNGINQFWSAAQATANADLFWTIDTRGYVKEQLRQTRRAQELETAQLRQDAEDLIGRLLAARRAAGALIEQLNQLDQLVSLLDKVPPDLDLNSLVQATETKLSLQYRRFKLRQDLAELNTLFWFVDEQQWVHAKGTA